MKDSRYKRRLLLDKFLQEILSDTYGVRGDTITPKEKLWLQLDFCETLTHPLFSKLNPL